MPEPLKNLYSKKFINSLAAELKTHQPDFDSARFNTDIFDQDWTDKELKQRMRHISICLHSQLPSEYVKALSILKSVSCTVEGFEYMFLPDYVERYGLNNFKASISALAHFTQYASSEFAVRQFIIKYPDKMMSQMTRWSTSKNLHLRRLSSEGCRPRLPWAIALPLFKQDPKPVLHILTSLKNDPSEYVRRSVANNLNDISKDNPDIVITLAKSWLGQSKETDWVVKHACRSLLKQGLPDVMAIFGYQNPRHIKLHNFAVQKSVKIGERLAFSFTLLSPKRKLGKIRIEYAIYFMKKNNTQTKKVFKISETDCNDNSKIVDKSHSFKLISTRKYHAGLHGLAIIVNGQELGHNNFQLSN